MKLRQQLSVSVGTTSKVIAGANERRTALLISSLPGNEESGRPVNTTALNASTAATGVKASYTVPAGKTATLNAASAFAKSGTTQVSQLQLVTGGNTIVLSQAAPSAVSSQIFTLNAGDTIQWNCTNAVAATTEDYTISVTEYANVSRVTLGFAGPAVLDQGINVNPGADCLALLYDHIGQAIREDVTAIAATGTVLLGILEIYERDCLCPVGQEIEKRLRT